MTKKYKMVGPLLILLLSAITGCGGPRALLIQPVDGSRQLKETVLDQDQGLFVQDKIALLNIDGLMTNSTESSSWIGGGENALSSFVEKLDKAQKDQQVKAVLLRINSPGGSVAASDAMLHALMQFRKETKKPVVACLMDVAASGGYYLACGCDEIIALPGTVTGSIGTIMQTISVKGTMDKIGIKAVAIKSGKLKDIASPLKDLQEEEKKVLQDIINQFYEKFLTVVLEGRPDMQEEKLRQLADGRVYTAADALDNGLIDRIGYPDQAVKRAKELAKVEKAKIVMYHRPSDYTPNLYATAASQTGIQNALVHIELPQWLRGGGTQFLYLWQTQIE